jgi:hypothetical protein
MLEMNGNRWERGAQLRHPLRMAAEFTRKFNGLGGCAESLAGTRGADGETRHLVRRQALTVDAAEIYSAMPAPVAACTILDYGPK